MFPDLITAFVSSLVVFLGFLATRRSTPWNSRTAFFILTFLFTWSAGVISTPFGPTAWGVAWMPYLFFSLVFALIVGAISPGGESEEVEFISADRFAGTKEVEVFTGQTATASIGVFFWTLFAVLVIGLAIHYSDNSTLALR
jgi:hypothetical protein